MTKIHTPEERAAYVAYTKALTEEAQANWHKPTWRYEMAEILTQTITKGFEQANILDLLTNVENLSPTGRAQVSELRGMKVFWIAPGGYIEESTVQKDVFEIQRDTLGFHVSEFEDKLEMDFGLAQADLIDLGVQRLAGEINLRVLRTFQAAVPSTSPYYTAANGLSLDTLNTAIRAVKNETNDDITIIGLSTMTDKIVDGIINLNGGGGYAAFLPQTNEDLFARGVIGRYRNCNIVTLQNFKDDLDRPFFPANELWVVGRDASKFAFWGGPKFKEFLEDDNWFWHYLQRRDFGGLVWRPERLRRIIDTSQPAY